MRKSTYLFALLGVALTAPLYVGSASAQATRTWVSGVGDDANPCSRTAPCKTFAGAISKTATNGEINCIDPAGFGALGITKGITVDCGGTFGSVLSAGTNGFNINAAGAKVTLRNISINGAGTGVHGINIIAAAQVLIENVQVFGITGNGINTSSLASTANVQVKNASFFNITGTGISLATTAGFALGQISRASFLGTATGVSAGANAFVSVSDSTFLQNTNGSVTAGSGT
jgi:hypothetical protein